MRSVYLRLAAPLQSWAADRLTGNMVHTKPRPTRAGLEGLVAAACGIARRDWSRTDELSPEHAWIRDIRMTLRADEPGAVQDEFNTINPRKPDDAYYKRMVTILTGTVPNKFHSTPDGQDKTAVIRRTLLADAAFMLELSAGKHTETLYDALSEPVFSPYLGKRAFAPTFPFLLGIGAEGLLDTLPALSSPFLRAGLSTAPLLYDANRDRGRITETRIRPGNPVRVPVLGWMDWCGQVSRTLDKTGAGRKGGGA